MWTCVESCIFWLKHRQVAEVLRPDQNQTVQKCALQTLPTCYLMWRCLHFFTWPIWAKFSRKIQVYPQPKILSLWLIPNSSEDLLSLGYCLKASGGLFSGHVPQWGYLSTAAGVGDTRLLDKWRALYSLKDGGGLGCSLQLPTSVCTVAVRPRSVPWTHIR